MTQDEYKKWLKRATKRQIVFVNTYLKTLNPTLALTQAGYNYTNTRVGRWKVFNKLFPVIQYKISQYDLNINKPFIVNNWLQLLYQGDSTAKATALKELSKLFGFVDQGTKVQIENNIPSTPVVIKFNEKQQK